MLLLLLTFSVLWLLLSNMLKLFVKAQSNIKKTKKIIYQVAFFLIFLMFLFFFLNVIDIVIVGSFFVTTNKAIEVRAGVSNSERLAGRMRLKERSRVPHLKK